MPTPASLLLRAAVLALALGAAATAVQAQWKWRDKNGQVNVSDRPPPMDVPEKDILARPSPETLRKPAAPAPSASGPASGPGARGPLERELELRRRAAEQEQSAKGKAEEERLSAQRAENCRRARNQLAALESGQRMARFNDKGEREILDDRGRAEEMRQAREVIASDCR